jgi:Cofactor assembly of complex C subunit B
MMHDRRKLVFLCLVGLLLVLSTQTIVALRPMSPTGVSVPRSVIWRTTHQAIYPASTIRDKAVTLRLGLWDNLVSEATSWIADAPPETAGISYSKASYYTILGLYLISFPGLWSTIKRSTKAKVQRKEFVVPGEKAVVTTAVESDGTAPKEGQSLRQTAGEIMAYMKANNYDVTDAGETITFRGIVPRSPSQAFFLTFCTALGLLSLGLVLQIQFQGLVLPLIGEPNWFYLALLSPYAGLYYWKSGDRIDECSVKLAANDDETENMITVQGSEEELDRLWRTLGWRERGMVRVEGILDQIAASK